MIIRVDSTTGGPLSPSDQFVSSRAGQGGTTNTFTYIEFISTSSFTRTQTNITGAALREGFTSNRTFSSFSESSSEARIAGGTSPTSAFTNLSNRVYTSLGDSGYTVASSLSYNGTSTTLFVTGSASPNAFEITTTQTYSIAIPILTTSSDSPFFQFWTLVASNTAGTEITETDNTERMPFRFESTTSSTRVVKSTSTCGRQVTTTCIHFVNNPYNGVGEEWLENGKIESYAQTFFIKKASTVSFNSNEFYHLTDCADVSTGATSSVYEVAFETFPKFIDGGIATGGFTDVVPFPNDPNITFPLSDSTSQEFTLSYHPSGGLTTSTYTTTQRYSTFTITDLTSFRDTSDQINQALYGGLTTSANANTNVLAGTNTYMTTAYLLTAKTQICVTSFFDQGTRTLTGPFLQTILTKTGVRVNGNLNYSSSFSSSVSGNGGGTSTGSVTQRGIGEDELNQLYTNLFSKVSLFTDYADSAIQAPPYNEIGKGAGVHVIYTDLKLIDFLLQDPFSMGTSFPAFKEISGGYSNSGLIGGSYKNPQNFFNLEDDLVANIPNYEQYFGKIGGNSHRVEGCLALNNDVGLQRPLASCPITMNTTASFTIENEITQFITYSFSTGSAYSITTLNSGTVTASGTATHRWQAVGEASTGYRDNLDGYSAFQVNKYVGTNGMTFSPHAGVAHLFTDYSLNSSNLSIDSTTGIVKGFFGSDLSPSSAFPYSVTRSLGKRVDAALGFDISPNFSPCPAIYVKRVPSFLGFNSSFFSERLQGGVFAGIANTYADPSF